MPAANKTPNIELNQWVGNEYPKRQDFADDNLKIDTAITGTNNDLAAHLAETAQKHITESGSNENGHYVRFDNGLQVCWKARFVNHTTTDAGLWTKTWIYPAAYFDRPAVIISYGSTGTGVTDDQRAKMVASNESHTTNQAVVVYEQIYGFTSTFRIDILAIGGWK